MANVCPSVYRARNPRATPLYRLFDAHFDDVRGQWEERFERRFGFWRAFVDDQVLRYLDCGLFENGFARIRCPDCIEEYLLAFSCKTRELCPSCAAKRAAATAAILAEEVFDEVAHAQWVFVIPKMLRPYFLHHRALLGKLAKAAWETVLELMVTAVGDEAFRPGMVAVVQTAGDMGALVASSRETTSSSRSEDDCGSRLIGTRLKPRRGAETGIRMCMRSCRGVVGHRKVSGFRLLSWTSIQRSCFFGTR